MIRHSRIFAVAAVSSLLAGCGGAANVARLPQAAGSHGSERQSTRTYAAAAATAAPVQAGSAQAFVDSVGTNVHMRESNGYGPATFSKLQSMLVGSGIRHLRDGMLFYMSNASTIVSEEQQLAAKNIRFDYIIRSGDTAAQDNGWFNSVGPNVADACEGANEPDDNGGTWAPQAVADQQTVYGVCHPLGLPVYASAMGNAADYSTFGNQSAYADSANVHDYFTWHNPGTPGFYDGDYGSLAYNERNAAAEAPGKGFVSTETGYSSYPSETTMYLPEPIRARYLVRTALEAFRAGVKRTYEYEFIDEGTNDPYCHHGLVDASLNPKAAYGAVSGILSMLADPNTGFIPGSLGFTVNGGDANMHTVLLQKHDGTFWLALWEETQEYDGGSQTTTNAASESLTLTFAQTPAAIKTYALQDAGTYASTAITPSGSIPLSVDGHPTLMQITPQRAVSLVQFGTANSGGYGGSFPLTLPNPVTPGNFILGQLSAPPSSTTLGIDTFAVQDALANNGQIAFATNYHIVNPGDQPNLTATSAGGDWKTVIAAEMTGEDKAAPIASDTTADFSHANIYCPATKSGIAVRAGSLVTCTVYVNGGTGNPSLSQSPTPPAGWVFDRVASAQFNETFFFHRQALTSAGENVPAAPFNMSTNGNGDYLTGMYTRTILVQPPTS